MPEQRVALYRLLAENGRLLYVGISGNPDVRWGTHSNKQPWWSEVADRKVEWFPTRIDAACAEVRAIQDERPLYNKQHSVLGKGETRPAASSGAPSQPEPLQDLDAEQCTLGGMLLSIEVIDGVIAALDGTDFAGDGHAAIYGAIRDLYVQGESTDWVTVSAELTKRGRLLQVNGMPYIRALADCVPSAANTSYYAEIVRTCAVQRRRVGEPSLPASQH